MEWSNETVLEFIELLQREPVIWDNRNKNSQNRNAVNEAWKRIVDDFSASATIEELKRKRNSLLTQYRDNLRKIRESIKSGCGADVYQPTWFAFDLMHSYLGSLYKIKTTFNTGDRHNPDASDDSTNRPLSRGSNSSDNESLPSTSGARKRRRAQDITFESHSVDAEFAPYRIETKSDVECDLFGQLLAEKLKKMDEDIRLKVMNDIDNLAFQYAMEGRARRRESSRSSINRLVSKAEKP